LGVITLLTESPDAAARYEAKALEICRVIDHRSCFGDHADAISDLAFLCHHTGNGTDMQQLLQHIVGVASPFAAYSAEWRLGIVSASTRTTDGVETARVHFERVAACCDSLLFRGCRCYDLRFWQALAYFGLGQFKTALDVLQRGLRSVRADAQFDMRLMSRVLPAEIYQQATAMFGD
jgi:hypothetical protein